MWVNEKLWSFLPTRFWSDSANSVFKRVHPWGRAGSSSSACSGTWAPTPWCWSCCRSPTRRWASPPPLSPAPQLLLQGAGFLGFPKPFTLGNGWWRNEADVWWLSLWSKILGNWHETNSIVEIQWTPPPHNLPPLLKLYKEGGVCLFSPHSPAMPDGGSMVWVQRSSGQSCLHMDLYTCFPFF